MKKKWWRNLFNLFSSERKSSGSPFGGYNERGWREQIPALRERSQKWTDNDLKDIVEAIYFLNHQMLSLANYVRKTRADISEVSRKLEDQIMYTQKPYSTAQFGQRPKIESEKPPMTREADLARSDLETGIKTVRLFIQRYEGILNLLNKNKNTGLNTFKDKLKQPYEHILSKLTDLNRSAVPNANEYRSLSDELRRMKLTNLTINLCILADEEMSDRRREEKELLESKTAELADFVGLAVLNPTIGRSYNEREHEIVGTERGSRNKRDTVFEVHQRGYRQKKTGKIEKKARITIVK